jgi:asparagine synthase (glutamine-hydrolysing)
LFAVILNTDGGPADSRINLGVVGAAGHDVEVVGSARRIAFVSAKGASGIQSLGGRYWIVGRIRLDARGDLQALMADRSGASSSKLPAAPSDSELCLHAYAAWGDAFVDRLAGDFCFALWDDEHQRLVCVRDQLGVRCLFHAEGRGVWFVSDSLDWIAALAPVARDLDVTWIADFLTVGHSLDVERTAYRHIRRLAPAHILSIVDGRATVRRYWRLDVQEPLYYRDRRLYTERFLDLMAQSIGDRLPAGRVGISMSGGLDSTTLAACAVRATGDPARVVAQCLHFDKLFPDREKHFSALAAAQLGIELRLRAMDDFTYDPQWRSRSIATIEPQASIVAAYPERAVAREQAMAAQVWFHGEGPDNAMVFERDAYLGWLVGRRDWWRLGEAALLYVKSKGLAGWMQTLRRYSRRRAAVDDAFAVPPWLDRALVDRLDLKERLRGIGEGSGPAQVSPHPWHPRAIASFNDPIWASVFGDFDFVETLAPLVWRHPFLDLRVLEFMLSLPPVPWGWEKLLLREAMQGRLPDKVLSRRKSPLAGFPLTLQIRAHGLPDLSGNAELKEYVDIDALPTGIHSERDLQMIVAVHALDHWLEARAT